MTSTGLATRLEEGERRIAEYTDPRNAYAFTTYDRSIVHDGPLTPADVLLANLLSLRLGWRQVVPLFAEREGPERDLRLALDTALDNLRDARPFESYETLDELEDAVLSLAAANHATAKVNGWTAVTVSKVLHRRRPHIVPIIDSRVRAFYGARKPRSVRAALWHDIRENAAQLEQLSRRPDGTRLSLLRVADILIWTP